MRDTITYTTQTAFDKISAHLVKQDRRARPSKNIRICQLKTAEGLQCAVGCLIPDEDYRIELEQYLVRELVAEVPCLRGLDAQFLRDMQLIHDKENVENWPRMLRQYARKNGLVY